jgi:hypothetical protein
MIAPLTSFDLEGFLRRLWKGHLDALQGAPWQVPSSQKAFARSAKDICKSII